MGRVKKGFAALSFLLVIGTGVTIVLRYRQREASQSTPSNRQMVISSPAFQHGEFIPVKYTCDGDNVSPQLSITDVPQNAVSLALIADDPDAPGGNWVHWLMWNIPSKTVSIAEGAVPVGAVEGATDFKKPGYDGPCPPSGTHRYVFRLYALDTILALPQSTTRVELERAMDGHVVAQAVTAGNYQRR